MLINDGNKAGVNKMLEKAQRQNDLMIKYDKDIIFMKDIKEDYTDEICKQLYYNFSIYKVSQKDDLICITLFHNDTFKDVLIEYSDYEYRIVYEAILASGELPERYISCRYYETSDGWIMRDKDKRDEYNKELSKLNM